MDGPGIRTVPNETQAHASRATKDGRHFTYRINIIQQPERARACGSGAKSSADRRPVDPPPIVELKIFEGEGTNNDVTFNLNANFFLFAALEPARNIANGRVAQDLKSPPVLTGSPVAGMVYLDRPEAAGYFIFPDLSVRHEGKYRIVFSLFEQIKDPRDEDVDDSAKTAVFKDGWVSQRVEVRSKPFQVYSAKKFPGLAESTALSRTVAEQGCRVRIRRDVRMRRRQDKPTKDWDGYEDETAEARGRMMSATPETSGYHGHAFVDQANRQRSTSNGSHVSLAPSLSRRPSLQEISQGLPQPAYTTAPHTPQNAYPQSSPYVPTPTPQYAQSSYAHHQSTMQPPPMAYQSTHYQQQPSIPSASAPQQGYYSWGPPPPVSAAQSQVALPLPNYEPQRLSVDYSQVAPDYHRRSSQYTQPEYSQAHAYHPAYPGQHIHHTSTGSWDGYTRATPAEPVQPPTRTTGAHTPLSIRSYEKLPPLNTTFDMASLKPAQASSPLSSIPQSSSYYGSISQQTPMEAPQKRGYGQVFNDRHLSQPLRQGARPSVYSNNGNLAGLYTPADDEPAADQNEFDGHTVMMSYRRADGRTVNRNLPPHD